ncbi:hypothetical protein DBR06_SOUSAS5810090, partial [Sousa chinensis]
MAAAETLLFPMTDGKPKEGVKAKNNDHINLKVAGLDSSVAHRLRLSIRHLIQLYGPQDRLLTHCGKREAGEKAGIGSAKLKSIQRDDTGEIPQHSREAQEVAAACGQDALGTGTVLPSQCSSDDVHLTAS